MWVMWLNTRQIEESKNYGEENVVIHEEVIDVFHNKLYIPTMGNFSFHLDHVRIIGSMECGNTENDCFHENLWKNNLKLNKYYAEKFSETTGIEIQSQHWGRNIQLLMEGIYVEYLPN